MYFYFDKINEHISKIGSVKSRKRIADRLLLVDANGVVKNGGTITFVTSLKNTTKWSIALCRGQSENCAGLGMTLIKHSTQLLVYRMGDA